MISVKNMGRWSYSTRIEADTLKRISIYWLKKNNYLKGGFTYGTVKWTNSWTEKENTIGLNSFISENDAYVQIYYTQTDDEGNKKDYDYKVILNTTPCYFGGFRYWFSCPLSVRNKFCGRRVGVLYKAGNYFGCRHCYNLTYSIQKASGIFRYGGNISAPELDELRSKVKRTTYRGKLTRRLESYLKKVRKFNFGLEMAVKMLGRKRK